MASAAEFTGKAALITGAREVSDCGADQRRSRDRVARDRGAQRIPCCHASHAMLNLLRPRPAQSRQGAPLL
jgi:hypothetical protein